MGYGRGRGWVGVAARWAGWHLWYQVATVARRTVAATRHRAGKARWEEEVGSLASWGGERAGEVLVEESRPG